MDGGGGGKSVSLQKQQHEFGGKGGKHGWITAGDVGTPGVITGVTHSHPPKTSTNHHSKVYQFEITNSNYDTMTMVGMPGNNEAPNLTCLKTPYYNFLWQYLFWYLDTAEMAYYSKMNYARVKKVHFEIHVIGVRLPFTTNDAGVSVANSQVDQVLDVFKGLEKRGNMAPLVTAAMDNSTRINPTNSLFLSNPARVLAFHSKALSTLPAPWNGFNLYGTSPILFPAEWDNIEQGKPYGLGANQTYQKYNCFTTFIQNNGSPPTTGTRPPASSYLNQYASFPPMARYSNMFQLGSFTGKVAEISYEPKRGVFAVSQSIYQGTESQFLAGNFTLTEKEKLLSSSDATYSQKGAAPNQQWTTQYIYEEKHGGNWKAIQPLAIQTDVNDLNFFDPRMMTVDGPIQGFGEHHQDFDYESLTLGVRPNYNADAVQQGITSIEIRTSCEIEYAMGWNTETDLAPPININKWNNTNDHTQAFNTQYWGVPYYGQTSKAKYWMNDANSNANNFVSEPYKSIIEMKHEVAAKNGITGYTIPESIDSDLPSTYMTFVPKQMSKK